MITFKLRYRKKKYQQNTPRKKKAQVFACGRTVRGRKTNRRSSLSPNLHNSKERWHIFNFARPLSFYKTAIEVFKINFEALVDFHVGGGKSRPAVWRSWHSVGRQSCGKFLVIWRMPREKNIFQILRNSCVQSLWIWYLAWLHPCSSISLEILVNKSWDNNHKHQILLYVD